LEPRSILGRCKPSSQPIVGVAGNVREVRPGAEQRVQIYEPFAQSRMISGIFLAVRTKADPLRIVPAIQDRVWAIDRNRSVVMIKNGRAADLGRLRAASVAKPAVLALQRTRLLSRVDRRLRRDVLSGIAANERNRHPHGVGCGTWHDFALGDRPRTETHAGWRRHRPSCFLRADSISQHAAVRH